MIFRLNYKAGLGCGRDVAECSLGFELNSQGQKFQFCALL